MRLNASFFETNHCLHRSLFAFLALLPAAALAAQSTGPVSGANAQSVQISPPAALPKPTLGWILENNSIIAPVFGNASFEISSGRPAPSIAMDGAGNIDGAALIGSAPANRSVTEDQPVADFALKNAAAATLLDQTTVLLLCGREDNWLWQSNGALLPVQATRKRWSVTKPGEWGLSLASTISPFAVVSNGALVYANAPPLPTQFKSFASGHYFPPRGANAQVCVWGFYDTAVEGSTSEPAISVAYDDGPRSASVTLTQPVLAGTSPVEVIFDQVAADLGTLFIWQGKDAEAMFQQARRASYWNGGLRKSIASQFDTPDWDALQGTLLDPRPIALGGDAQDNVWAVAYPGFKRTSPFAHYSVTTSPGTPFLAVRYRLGTTKLDPIEFSVSFLLDGEYMGYDQPWRFGTIIRSIPLPQDGRSHTVELRNGFTRGNGDYAAPTMGEFGGGGFIDAVAVPAGHKVTVDRPEPESVALVLSHSVAVGDFAGSYPYRGQGPQSSVAWPVQARGARAFGTSNVVDESYGGELLANECWTPAECNSYIAAIKKAQPRIKVGFVARMINDFFHGRSTFDECLPEYEQTMQNLLNAWARELPGVPLYVGSDIREAAGWEAGTDDCRPAMKLADWRAGIESTVNAYAAQHNADWLHFVDMSDWVPQDELVFDGIHPNVEGQIKMCQAVVKYFHQPGTCGVPR
jgi:hypothetical protein